MARGEGREGRRKQAQGLVVTCLVVTACVQPTEPSASRAAAPLPAFAPCGAAMIGGHLCTSGSRERGRAPGLCAPISRPTAAQPSGGWHLAAISGAGTWPPFLRAAAGASHDGARWLRSRPLAVALALAAGAGDQRGDSGKGEKGGGGGHWSQQKPGQQGKGREGERDRGGGSGPARAQGPLPGGWRIERQAQSTGKVVGGTRASAGTVAARRNTTWPSPAERHAAAEAAVADLAKAVDTAIAQWERLGGGGRRGGGGRGGEGNTMEVPSVVRFNKALKLCALDYGNMVLAQRVMDLMTKCHVSPVCVLCIVCVLCVCTHVCV